MTAAQKYALWRMQHSTAPILIGPWRSEVGFEVLYWLPFVAHLRQAYGLKRDRLIAVSRGGAAHWYDTPHQVELFDYEPPDNLRLQMLQTFQATKSVKQQAVEDWERTLLPRLAQRLGLRRYHVLHPSLMYQSFRSWWGVKTPMATVMQQLAWAAITPPPRPADLGLPDEYIVVKFYDRPTFPSQDQLVHWAQDLVERVSRKVPVVLLHTGLFVDDHVDFPMPTGPRIVSLAGRVDVRSNLGVQSAVLAKAKAFIGTYGGMMQLAVRLGIPAAGFYSEFKDTAYSHKLLTEYLGVQFKQSVFIGRPQDASFVSQSLSELA